MAGLGSQELYRMVLDSLPVAVCAVDREGKVILWNDGAERVTGYLRQDVLGRLCSDEYLNSDENCCGVLRSAFGNQVAYSSWGDYFLMEALARELFQFEPWW